MHFHPIPAGTHLSAQRPGRVGGMTLEITPSASALLAAGFVQDRPSDLLQRVTVTFASAREAQATDKLAGLHTSWEVAQWIGSGALPDVSAHRSSLHRRRMATGWRAPGVRMAAAQPAEAQVTAAASAT